MSDMINRHQHAVRFHQLVEDILQNVPGVARVGHANELFGLVGWNRAMLKFA